MKILILFYLKHTMCTIPKDEQFNLPVEFHSTRKCEMLFFTINWQIFGSIKKNHAVKIISLQSLNPPSEYYL